MKTTRQWLLVAFGALFIVSRAAAADPDLTGTWTLGVEGDHVIPMAMVMKQEGGKITGTIAMPTNQHGDRRDIAFEGEVSATGFSFATKEGKPLLEFTGKVNDDGSLDGSVTLTGGSDHGAADHKMHWTAERLKERKKG
jgi:hypothetical protein